MTRRTTYICDYCGLEIQDLPNNLPDGWVAMGYEKAAQPFRGLFHFCSLEHLECWMSGSPADPEAGTMNAQQQAQWERVREKMLEIIQSDDCDIQSKELRACAHWDYDGRACYAKTASGCTKIDQILAIPELAVLDSDQTPPETYRDLEGNYTRSLVGWRRVLPRPEEVPHDNR